MQKVHRSVFAAVMTAAGLMAIATCGPIISAQQAQPAITITEVPPAGGGGPDQMFPISGRVSGIPSQQYSNYKVVIYVYAGTQWWVQPFDYAPKTSISSSGQYETETHGGSIYAALLVRSTYQPKATTPTLPEVQGDVVARLRVAGKKENQ